MKYQFGKFFAGHMFCKTCGSNVCNFLTDPNAPTAPVNARAIACLDLDLIKREPQTVEVKLPDGNVLRRTLGDAANL